MGPWFDSIGFGVVALMHGACYVPRVLGAVYCSTGDHPTWSEAFHHDSNQAIRTFEHVAHFLRASEAASYVPADIALILEAKVVLGLSAEIKNPLLLPRLFNQTHELIRSGRLQEADRWLAWIIGLNDVLPDLRLDWGVVQLALGRSADAEASFRRALELNPNLASAYSNLGVCLQRRGAVEEAIWAYRRAVQIDPQFGSAYANLGRLLSTHGRHEEALPAMQMAMQLNPQL
jgi:tetratricopeptide (TPR) repeat protein